MPVVRNSRNIPHRERLTYKSHGSSSRSQNSSTRSTRSSPVHAASLVDPATHCPTLMQLVDINLSKPVIEYIVDCITETVVYALCRASSFNEPTIQDSSIRYSDREKSMTFVSLVLSRAGVPPATVLVALGYIARVRAYLCISLEKWAFERVFLGALIIAAKYTNDSTLKNVHWAMCTGVFGKRDIGLIEREFLIVLDWKLGVEEADLLVHHEGLIAAAVGSRLHISAVDQEADYVSTPHPASPAAVFEFRSTAPDSQSNGKIFSSSPVLQVTLRRSRRSSRRQSRPEP